MTQALVFEKPLDASFALRNRAVVIFVSIVLLLPSLLFAAALRPFPAFLVIAGCVGALGLIAQRGPSETDGPLDAPLAAKRLALSVALAGAILVLGGAMHVFHPPPDWHIRDAVLADLSQNGFPVVYGVGSTDYLLRAPLAMYMIPAAFGRAFGLFSAHVALWAQNSLLLGAILYLLGTLGRGWRHVMVMLLFGSVALLGTVVLLAAVGQGEPPSFDPATASAFDAWRPYMKPWGSFHQFFWVPNHALPAWWLATLMLLNGRSQCDAGTLAVSIAGCAFWSPLAVLPAAIWAICIVLADWRRHLASRRIWLAALFGLCFLPIAIYMVTAAATITHGVAPVNGQAASFPPLVALVFLHVAYILTYRALVPKRLLLLYLVNLLVLIVLPYFQFGPNHDLMTRASIAPVVVTSFVFGWILFDARLGRRGFYLACALLAAGTPAILFELAWTTTRPAYALSDCSLMEAGYAGGDREPPSNYVVESANVPTWLMNAEGGARKLAKERSCWP